MATPVEAPKLGNTVEEVIVAKWHKRKGDAVKTGDVVALLSFEEEAEMTSR